MTFSFTPENLEKAKEAIAKYPQGRQASALLAVLDMAQRQNGGWLSSEVLQAVADFLDVPRVRVQEAARFYSMCNLAPVGKYVIEICTTTPCWLRGSAEIMDAFSKKLGIAPGETTSDGMFTLREVDCIAACVNAPVAKIGDDYFENLTPEKAGAIVEALSKGEESSLATKSPARCAGCGQTGTACRAPTHREKS